MQTNSSSINTTNELFEKVSSACVVGLGQTGQSCLRYLNDKAIDLVVMDSGRQPKDLETLKADYPQVDFVTGRLDADRLLDSNLIVLSPGVPRSSAEILRAEQKGVPIVGDIELFAHETDGSKIISITGSNGKSTVTALCGELLKEAGFDARIGGNIGYPALDLLNMPADIYVLELSSFQLESTYNLKSTVAVILNISPDHMDRYESIENYIQAKQRIFNQARNIVYNRADKDTFPENHNSARVISFGLDQPQSNEDFGIISVLGEQWLCQGDKKLVSLDALQTKGQHNQLNALAAMALAYLIGADLEKTVPALLAFKGLPHRFEHVGDWNGVEWINDSKGTNPGATLASIKGQIKPIVLIIGGDAKGADFSILSDEIKEHVKTVILFGRDAALVEQILPVGTPSVCAVGLTDAITKADQYSSENDMVLFSPACASFDMFKNYVERGDAFKSAVENYFNVVNTQ